MSVLSVLGQAAGVAGAGYKGYGEDKQDAVKNVLARQTAAREEDDSRVRRVLEGSQARASDALADVRASPPEGFMVLPDGSLVRVNKKAGTASFVAPTEPAATPPVVTTPPAPPTSVPQGPPSVTAPPSVAPTAAPDLTPDQKDWDDAVKLHGEATVLKEYGPRPNGVPPQAKAPAQNPAVPAAPSHPTFAKAGTPSNFVDPQGGVHLVTPQEAQKNGWTKQTSAGRPTGAGQGGALGLSGGIGSVNEMDFVHPRLSKFETGLLSEADGSPSLKMFDTFRQQILDAGTRASHSGGGIGDAISSAVNAFLRPATGEEVARMNPALANYARDLATWIVSDLNLSRGATDQRGEWDRVASSVLGGGIPLSSMPVGDRVNYIHGILGTRLGRLKGLHEGMPAIRGVLNAYERYGTKKP